MGKSKKKKGNSKKKKNNNKKNKLVLVIVILVLIFLLGYYGYQKYKDEIEKNKLKVSLIDDLKIEINEEYQMNYFVKEIINGTLINGDEVVNNNSLGDLKLELVIKNDKEEEEKYGFKASVVDTTKPVIDARKEITSYVGNGIDLLSGVSASDNSKEVIKVNVIGDYDINKTGNYNLKYEASDSSGNKVEYDFVLNIVSDPNNRTFTTSKGYSGKVVNGVTYIDGVLIVNKTYSLPSSYGSDLTASTREAFNKMNADASALGLSLWISSGYRSYWTQKTLYNNYVSRDGIANADRYSARAGHSEHQTGLAFDLNTIDDSFTNTPEGIWVHDNCYKYGLILRYPAGKESITGYMHESWHLRYVGESLASKLYNDGDWITLEEYYGIDSKYS